MRLVVKSHLTQYHLQQSRSGIGEDDEREGEGGDQWGVHVLCFVICFLPSFWLFVI